MAVMPNISTPRMQLLTTMLRYTPDSLSGFDAESAFIFNSE